MTAIYKAGGEASKETNPGDTLILDIWPPELWGNTFLWFKLPSLWCFVLCCGSPGTLTQLPLLREWTEGDQERNWEAGEYALPSFVKMTENLFSSWRRNCILESERTAFEF